MHFFLLTYLFFLLYREMYDAFDKQRNINPPFLAGPTWETQSHENDGLERAQDSDELDVNNVENIIPK